ncbi:hypothetical protein CNR22_20380 [Sphingobacteriaceae bacterium]|nr:hypothetical protein CNR22_20380 [Sphingobacteriaceae bacterium]
MLSKDFYNSLTYISIISVIIPIAACFYMRKALSITLRALFVYLCICLLSDILSYFYSEYDEIQNLFRNGFTVIECVIISLIYYIEFKDQKIETFVIASLLLFIGLSLWQFLYLNLSTKIETIASTFEAVILSIFSIIYLLKFLFTSDVNSINYQYFFWIAFANLLYFGTAFIFFMFRNFIKNAPDESSDFIWGIHDGINVICNTLFTIAICKTQRK